MHARSRFSKLAKALPQGLPRSLARESLSLASSRTKNSRTKHGGLPLPSAGNGFPADRILAGVQNVGWQFEFGEPLLEPKEASNGPGAVRPGATLDVNLIFAESVREETRLKRL